MKKKLLAVVILTMALSLAACGGKKNPGDAATQRNEESQTQVNPEQEVSGEDANEQGEKDSSDEDQVKEDSAQKPDENAQTRDAVVGRWIADASEFMKASINQSGKDFAKYLNFDDAQFILCLDFKDDGTYEMTTNSADFLQKFQVKMKEGMRGYLTDSFKKMAQESGMTYEQLLAKFGITDADGLVEMTYGMSLDELIESFLNSENMSLEQAETNGTYRFEEGTIYLKSGEKEYSYEVINDTFRVAELDKFGELEFVKEK